MSNVVFQMMERFSWAAESANSLVQNVTKVSMKSSVQSNKQKSNIFNSSA